MKRIVVTGGSGKAGRPCARLLEQATTSQRPTLVPSSIGCTFLKIDLTDYGQTVRH